MKKYCETEGEDPFDWNEFLNSDDHDDDEWEQAEDLAETWTTCACGNQCEVILRDHSSGIPLDPELRGLGGAFYCRIADRDIEGAKECLHRIENRSATLIQEICTAGAKEQVKQELNQI